MKRNLIKYRSVVAMASALVFNFISSLLVWHPEGQKFNTMPMTTTEWFCDIISFVGFFVGFMTMFFDIHRNEKEKIKEAILEAKEELEKDGISLEIEVKEK